jgi:phosphatidylglycerophosphate synthase
VRAVQTGPGVGFTATPALLGVLDVTTTGGLGVCGWITGLACGLALAATLNWGLVASGVRRLGPADQITLGRAVLVCGVAALACSALVSGAHHPIALPMLAGVALALDAVDGWTARRTRTASPLGARFDMEVDAFLIVVLSMYVARDLGVWVLAIGAARYAFVAAGWVMPWMRLSTERMLPPRYWRKVVAATQGVVLTYAAAEIPPHTASIVALGVALALLAESFGRDVWWLWATARPPAQLTCYALTSMERSSDG